MAAGRILTQKLRAKMEIPVNLSCEGKLPCKKQNAR
jgi:hypothetical protein